MTSQLNVDTIVDKAGSGGTNIKVGNDATYVAEVALQTQTILYKSGEAVAILGPQSELLWTLSTQRL